MSICCATPGSVHSTDLYNSGLLDDLINEKCIVIASREDDHSQSGERQHYSLRVINIVSTHAILFNCGRLKHYM